MMKTGKKSKIIITIVFIFALIVLCGCVFPGIYTWETTAEESAEEIPSAEAGGETLEVHFIDVGQGDSTLIRYGDHAMLIDAGDPYSGETVRAYLDSQGIEALDAVVWTHPDSDHIGGAALIIEEYDIGTVYMTDMSSDVYAYTNLINALNAAGISYTVPAPGDKFALGEAVATFLGPIDTSDNMNDNSIALILNYGEISFLFTGDAESAEEEALMEMWPDLSATVYQAGHHGSAKSSGRSFLEEITPSFVVVSCGEGNDYGHPHKNFLSRVAAVGALLFRTDLQGTIVARTDGTDISWDKEPTDDMTPGVTTEEVTRTIPDGIKYIGNSKNMKLHRVDCTSTLPKESNRQYFYTLEEAIEAGYTDANQCKNCRPFDE